jgi:nucleoside-diphosphate-sugar epimerase
MKSSLFGKRRMNLVNVANVVAAIIFLSSHPGGFEGEVFIVSDDDAVANNFRDVESALMRGFGLPDYALPRIPLPLGFLRTLLHLLGRNNVNPRCNYSGCKLQALGFRRPMSFEAGLADYIASHPEASRVQEKTHAGT